MEVRDWYLMSCFITLHFILKTRPLTEPGAHGRWAPKICLSPFLPAFTWVLQIDTQVLVRVWKTFHQLKRLHVPSFRRKFNPLDVGWCQRLTEGQSPPLY